MTNGEIPAGWYPDPNGQGERWWDGNAWSEHTRNAAAEAAPAQPAQPAQVPAGWYPDPSGGGRQRWWDGNAWTDHVHPPESSGASAEAAASQQPTATQGAATAQATTASHGDIPAGWYPDPSGGDGQRWWDGSQWTENVHPEQPVAVEPEPEPAAVEPEPEPAAVEPEPEPAAVEPEPEPAAVEPEPATVEPAADDRAMDDQGEASADEEPVERPASRPSYAAGDLGAVITPIPTHREDTPTADVPAEDVPVADVPAEDVPAEDVPADPAALSSEPSVEDHAALPDDQATSTEHDLGEAAAEPSIPAGWYPDPSGGGGQRWWDGTQWTDQAQADQEPSEAAAQAIPAGWYPDPSGGGGQRWWDGTQWTEHVHPAQGTGAADRSAGPAAAQQGTSPQADAIPAGWYPDPNGQGERWWDGSAWSQHTRPSGG